MPTPQARLAQFPPASLIRTLLFGTAALALGLTTGCGGSNSGSSSPGPTLSGNTSVTFFPTSTANDQLQQFSLQITGLTLTSQSTPNSTTATTTDNLISTSEYPEFMHLNGTTEPFFTVSVPQGIYTSATATIGYASFTCATIDPSGGLDTSTYAYGTTYASQITVTLPNPITITGDAMGLSLNLDVSKSATYSSCFTTGTAPYSITPTISVTPVSFATSATTGGPLPLTNLQGLVTAVSSSEGSFTVTSADGPVWSIATGTNTVYQGISGPSALATGLPVDFDLAIQPDGSLTATRIEVDNTDPTNITESNGPLEFVSNAQPSLFAFGSEGQGYLDTYGHALLQAFSFAGPTFQTSGVRTNLQNLPFPATFTAANMVPGQNVAITSNSTTMSGGYPYTPAATLTLVPQTINGTIIGISTSGGFNTYTVSLAPYDLFPALAVQGGQTSLLSNPATVVVYADSSTQLLNTSAVAVGSVLRFNGLIFNSNGTLNMDCIWINDGVTP